MSRLTNVKSRSDVKNKEYGNQPYRSGFDFATQMRVATEKSKTFTNPNLPESELVRPYMSDSYETMEYDIVPNAGLQSMPTADTGPLAVRFDVDWDSPTVANIAFENAWGDEEVVEAAYIGTFYPMVSRDDGRWLRGVSSQYRAAFDGLRLGDSGTSYTNWIRFPNTIQAGARIVSATIRVNSISGTMIDTCNLKVHFNNVARAVAPLNYTECQALTITTGTAWNAVPNAGSGGWMESPDLKTDLQAIMDKKSREDGDAVMVIVEDNGSTNLSYRYVASKDGEILYYPGRQAQLQVTWRA